MCRHDDDGGDARAPTPSEAVPARATLETDAHMEEGPDDAVPMEEAAPVEEDSREQPAANAVEREIGDKTFKLGSLLSPEEQEGVAEVISRHLDAFAWSASDMPGIDPDFLCHHLNMDATVRPWAKEGESLTKRDSRW